MLRFIFLILFCSLLVLALAMFLTPFSGDFATQEYTLKNVDHVLSTYICPNPSQVPILSKSGLENQVDLLRVVVSALQAKDICFFAFADTLKGAVHLQGMLPWVDRSDVAMFLQDLSKLVSLRSYFEKRGLLLLRETDGYRICKNNWKRYPFVFVNLLENADTGMSLASESFSGKDSLEKTSSSAVFEETEDELKYAVCTPLSELNEPTWNGPHASVTFDDSELFPVEEMKFEDFSLPVPAIASQVLIKTPKSLLTPVPETDFDILFKNSAIQGLKNRAKGKISSVVGW